MIKTSLIGIAAVALFAGAYAFYPVTNQIPNQPLPPPTGPLVDVWAVQKPYLHYRYIPVGFFSAEPPIGPITSWNDRAPNPFVYNGQVITQFPGGDGQLHQFSGALLLGDDYPVAKAIPYSQAIIQFPNNPNIIP